MKRATNPGVLIVDAGERSAVAAGESLARAGYRVGTASSQHPAPAGWSRFSERRFRLPNPRVAPLDFAARAAAIAAAGAYRTVLPCSEGSLWAVSNNREQFDESEVTLGLPERGTVERCTDKVELVELAAEAGLSAPETVVCADWGEAIAAAERFGFPAVVKPRRTVFRAGEETRHLASGLVDGPRSLEARLAEAGLPCMIQRRERGAIVSVGGVFADGRLLATACSRYLRTWPAEAGSVSFSQSIEAPERLLDSVTRLLGSLGWEGMFELELIERGEGDYAVLDFNPRIYGSIALAVKAGVPLPVVWCDWLLKGKNTKGLAARPGIFYRWEDADLRNALRCLREGHSGRAASILRPRRGVAHAYFRWYDPLPLAVRGLRLLSHFGRGKMADRIAASISFASRAGRAFPFRSRPPDR
jgi:predicted ATP-grasp superfamily ATP-dependent carboligase